MPSHSLSRFFSQFEVLRSGVQTESFARSKAFEVLYTLRSNRDLKGAVSWAKLLPHSAYVIHLIY